MVKISSSDLFTPWINLGNRAICASRSRDIPIDFNYHRYLGGKKAQLLEVAHVAWSSWIIHDCVGRVFHINHTRRLITPVDIRRTPAQDLSVALMHTSCSKQPDRYVNALIMYNVRHAATQGRVPSRSFHLRKLFRELHSSWSKGKRP